MTRSKAFSEHQEERKQELLKKHGCYVLKNIKGDITVNNPENYNVEFNHRGKLRNESVVGMKCIIEDQHCDIEQGKEKIEIMILNSSREIEELKRRRSNREMEYLKQIKSYDEALHKLTKLQEYGNPFQKLLLRILGL